MALFSHHPLVLQTAFSDLKRRALEQASVLMGTPGSVVEKIVNGRPFLYRQYYDAQEKKLAIISAQQMTSGRKRAHGN